MATNQEARHAAVRVLTGTASDYNSDFLALFAGAGFSVGTFNERFLLWLNYQLGVTYADLPGAMHAYAAALGFDNWSNINTVTDLQAGGGGTAGEAIGLLLALTKAA